MYRRFNNQLKRDMIIIQPGEFYVTNKAEVIGTVLGSCISVCLRDTKKNVGGMNHFMLPGDFRVEDIFKSQSARYGMYAMELILGEIIKLGGGREHLSAKIFGGGHVLASVGRTQGSVPQSNIDFVKAFLSMEGIPILSSDVGGEHGRKVIFFPDTGKVFVRKLKPEAEKEIIVQERKFKKTLSPVKSEDVTLFE
jgi:chemotaxis protein CheD